MTEDTVKLPSPLALELLARRRVASLATLRADGSIHMTAIWFLFQNGTLYFPTNSSSRKARNVVQRPQASAMIDSRVPGREQGVTASGPATIVSGVAGRGLVALAQRRYLTASALADPVIGPAYSKFDDVVIALTPARWSEWDIARMNEETFEGVLGVESGFLYPYDA